jgi:hypothetical protein
VVFSPGELLGLAELRKNQGIARGIERGYRAFEAGAWNALSTIRFQAWIETQSCELYEQTV